MTRLGPNLLTTLSKIQEACKGPFADPPNFETIDHGYGFVLYTITLSSAGQTLATPNIRDYGYVFLNNIYQVGAFIEIYFRI